MDRLCNIQRITHSFSTSCDELAEPVPANLMSDGANEDVMIEWMKTRSGKMREVFS